MSAAADQVGLAARAVPTWSAGARAARLVERNILSYRRMWPAFASGLFEPVFYLFSLGVGLGPLVGRLAGPGGRLLEYPAFVAPGLLAAAAMNGAMIDATFGLFFKLKYAKTYEAVLSTPLEIEDVAVGEVAWSLLRGGIYSSLFIAVMAIQGIVESWWGLLLLPACLLIAAAFAAAGMACATFMRGWQDFDYVQLVLLPLFLFSSTFYPLSTYPPALRVVVWCTPLFHGVQLCRQLSVGVVDATTLVHVTVLIALSLVGLAVVKRRLRVLLIS
jgi:lipooligosaccharide transport system permease protein